MITTCIESEMAPSGTRGGWFIENNFNSTGLAFGTAILLCSPQPAAYIGTAGAKIFDSAHYRDISDVFLSGLRLEANSLIDIQRTAVEELQHIRTVLRPGVSELANTFGVSRQAIYNWLAGEVPSPSHAKKINDLAAAADVIKEEGISVTTNILKRKIKDGKSLFEIVRDGGSGKESARVLAGILRRESDQRKKLDQRLAGRAKPPINALDIGLPAFDEQV